MTIEVFVATIEVVVVTGGEEGLSAEAVVTARVIPVHAPTTISSEVKALLML